MDLKERELEDVDWMNVDRNRDQWRASIDTIFKPSFSIKGKDFLD
jgi:hypothetical protein